MGIKPMTFRTLPLLLAALMLFLMADVSWGQAAAPAAAPAAPAAGEAAKPAASGGISYFMQFFYTDDIPGLIQIWILVLMSIANMALVILFFVKTSAEKYLPPDAVDDYKLMLEEKRFKEALEVSGEDQTPLGEVLHHSLKEASAGWAHMQRAMEETIDMVAARLHRKIEILNIFGATGPMLGLFGTVYGMIVAFNKIVESGGTPDPSKLAGGIATALVTTFWGLVVGIPAVAAASVIKNKIDELMIEVALTSEEMIIQFKPKKDKDKSMRPAAPGAPGGRAPAPMPKPRPA